MNKTALIGIIAAVCLVIGVVFVSAQLVPGKVTGAAAAQPTTSGSCGSAACGAAGCDGGCGGNCGTAGCGCAKLGAESGCTGGCAASGCNGGCGGNCGTAGCGCAKTLN